ncbi:MULTISPECIES: ABC transporter substrate-binding protein [unclassified Streptomyces]|nr:MULTISPECIES: ABC transporter substrate-binding protein [unclassified Streptomyces]MCX5435671.1 ABC transporter substrate-binding protein [Streptomyces sp. NBC_00063]WSE13465.1 ABC transporter substrate-binding protein [Streptomyces sp. NBC_01397]WUB97619.1 ABC transporter substrate-binding protein [Streptomyces sp. NBC_00569]
MTVCFRQAVFVRPPVCVVAEELEFFTEAGVEVETVSIQSSLDQRDRLLSGNVDVGVTAMDNLVVWNAAGGDLRIVAQVETTTPLLLTANASVGTVEDLRGRKLGVDALANGFAVVLRHLLVEHGLALQECEFVPVGGVRERFEALRAGSIDATLLGPPLDELALREGHVALLSVADQVRDFPGQGIVAGARALRESEGLVRYLRALEAARVWLHGAPPHEALDVLTRGGYVAASARAALRTRPVSLAPERAGLARIVSMRDELGMLPDPVRIDELYDGRPLGLGLRS